MTFHEIEAAAIHADWRKFYAPEMPVELRDSMFADARLSDRIGAIVARAVGAADINPDDVQDNQARDYALYMNDPARARDLMGLLLRIHALAGVVARDRVIAAVETFGRETIETALRYRDAIGEAADDPEWSTIDPVAVAADGVFLIRSWAETLPDSMADRVALTLPVAFAVAPAARLPLARRLAIVESAFLALRGRVTWSRN